MPYICRERREDFGPLFDRIQITRQKDGQLPVGELNYIITRLLLQCKPHSYADYNALYGMLGCCQAEFYRRAVAVYEDEKIQENGDVYS